MHLSVMTQSKNFITVYYAHFRRMHEKQKQYMKDSLNNHVYYYMFIADLNKKINAEVLRFPELLKIEKMKFHEVLELAKKVKQIVKLQMNFVKNFNAKFNHSKKVKFKSKNNETKFSHLTKDKINREKLTQKKKNFLNNNIKREDELIIHKNVKNK